LIKRVFHYMLKIAYDPVYKYPLPEGHRFPMAKYELIPEQLLHEGTVSSDNFFSPGPAPESTILLTHTADYWTRLRDQQLSAQEIRAIGFPLTPQLVARSLVIANGTIRCAEYAQQHGVALNVAGGTHHAYAFRGEGFCCTNDMAVASNYLLHQGKVQKILIVDLDVHQGNGTAHIFQDEPRVFTFSMHGAKNYPHRKERSDLDIGLPDGLDDAAYLKILKETLPRLLDEVQPDLVFYLSGVDVLGSDKLGRLNLSLEGCKARDRFVFQQCKRNKLPVAVSMGGGYSERLATIVEAHANTYRVAQEVFF
jgi:acetoin utilization deacetylase AcuC-like enzyme